MHASESPSKRHPDDVECPSWCLGLHETPVPSEHGEWYLTHRSEPVGIFTTTDGESTEPLLGSVGTRSDVCDLAHEDEPRRIVLDMRTDCWGEAWLDPDQADVLADLLKAAAAQVRSGR